MNHCFQSSKRYWGRFLGTTDEESQIDLLSLVKASHEISTACNKFISFKKHNLCFQIAWWTLTRFTMRTDAASFQDNVVEELEEFEGPMLLLWPAMRSQLEEHSEKVLVLNVHASEMHRMLAAVGAEPGQPTPKVARVQKLDVPKTPEVARNQFVVASINARIDLAASLPETFSGLCDASLKPGC